MANSWILIAVLFVSICLAKCQAGSTPEDLKKLCPEANPNNLRIRFDPIAKKCGEIGSKAHCGQRMTFYGLKDDSVYGQCDCMRDFRHNRPYLYHKLSNQCYSIYSQGFCQSAWYWVTYDQETGPVCALNMCPTGGADTYVLDKLKDRGQFLPEDVVPFNIGCDVLGKPCLEGKGIISFLEDSGVFEPNCISKEVVLGRRNVTFDTLECRVGTKADIVDNCRKLTDDKPYRFVTFSEAKK